MLRKAVVVDRAAIKYTGFLLVFYAALLSSLHADPRYPDWPCMQPKVPELSAAAMWSGPSIADVGNSWQDDSKVRELVEMIARAARRWIRRKKQSRIS